MDLVSPDTDNAQNLSAMRLIQLLHVKHLLATKYEPSSLKLQCSFQNLYIHGTKLISLPSGVFARSGWPACVSPKTRPVTVQESLFKVFFLSFFPSFFVLFVSFSRLFPVFLPPFPQSVSISQNTTRDNSRLFPLFRLKPRQILPICKDSADLLISSQTKRHFTNSI